MSLVRCSVERHASEILAILNQQIAESTSIYEYHPRELTTMVDWFHHKSKAGIPVVGWMEGEFLAGFASYGSFRVKPAYKYTVEHSVYVKPEFHRRGIGRRLLREITSEAERAGIHVMVGCIDTANTASIRLHVQEGFELSGVVRHAGFKFGRWLDAAFYQKLLPGPTDPREG
ncbi:MAG: GNAT family N-acetyltransferase [Opitutaceae bacterium]|nr:GNAT family N-acetyltransferase [Opitutaceae bacterium]